LFSHQHDGIEQTCGPMVGENTKQARNRGVGPFFPLTLFVVHSGCRKQFTAFEVPIK